MEENLPPGFRFHPSDEELIACYLARKVSDDTFTTKVIAVVDLNKCEPWDLPAKASMGEKEWYFFNLRDRKYPTGLRTNRATEAGYWKTTGKDKEIVCAKLIGMKKTLVFYRGRAPKGEKTDWVMHEYRLQNNHIPFTPNKEEWVVCRIFKKNSSPKKSQVTTSTLPSLESPNHEANPNVINEFGDNIELTNIGNFTNNSNMFGNISVHDYNGENNLSLSTENMGNIGMNNNSLPFLPWTSPSLLNSSFSMNSLLLKAALQVRNYQQSEVPSTSKIIDYNSSVQQGFNQYGTDFGSSSTTATLDPMQPLQSQDQHLNKLDYFNW